MTMIAIANRATLTSTRMIAIALPSVVSPGCSPTRRPIAPMINSRAHTAAWSAAATMNRMWVARATLGGASA